MENTNRPTILAKGYTYRMIIAGTECVAKITMRSGHLYRGKVATDKGSKLVTFVLSQVESATRLD